MKIDLDLDLSPAEFERLETLAKVHGFTKGESEEEWTDEERQEAVRWYSARVLKREAQSRWVD